MLLCGGLGLGGDGGCLLFPLPPSHACCDQVKIFVQLTKGMKNEDVDVNYTTTHIQFGVKGQAPIVDGDFPHPILNACLWTCGKEWWGGADTTMRSCAAMCMCLLSVPQCHRAASAHTHRPALSRSPFDHTPTFPHPVSKSPHTLA